MDNLTLFNFKHYYKNICDIKSCIEEKKSILITGNSGIGKTTLCNLIFKDYDNLDILSINSDNFDNINQLKKTIQHFCILQNIQFYFKKFQKLIFIDDIDVLLSIDKFMFTFLSDLVSFKFNSLGYTFKNISIICCGNIFYEKKLNDLKKIFIYSTHLRNLSAKETIKIIKDSDNYEDLEYNDYLTLIKNNNNVRSSLLQLQTKNINQNNKINFIGYTIYEVVKYFFTNKLTDDEIKNILDYYELNLLFNMIHENLLEYNYNNYKKICKLFCIADIFEKKNFESCNWSNYYNMNYWKFKYINHLIIRENTKKEIQKINFPQVINKYSISLCFNKKLIKNEFLTELKRCNLINYINYLNFIVDLINSKNFKNYNISKIDLEILLRYANDFNNTILKNKIIKIKKMLSV